ncbi:flowering time control protein FPA-like isoform X2 [Magnolia sinica]|uniref:flowering time control protein FPA-like isoform X2 n=1 Tax=Magnolia sinica TaxID=86752 RepID=UPI0026589FAC|nr:flowering time control protein FPA-like isoform X2 [Magnolia sinica]
MSPKKQNMPAGESKEIEDDGAAGNGPYDNLFVGNISAIATDTDLMEVFAKHGALDAVTTYAARSHAIVFFKNVDDARAAKDALQGVLVCGSPMRIKFARPDKPGRLLWVGAISSSVTKEQLEDEFSKFGKFEEFKFFRDRNSALVDYYNLEDAVAALKNMNGKHLGGEQIRVDFLRSQHSRREKPDSHDPRNGHFNKRKRTGRAERMPPDVTRNFHASSQFGPKRHPMVEGRRGKGQPTKILWIGYPPSVQIDEQMLYNSMILFGEIERIKSFPSRHYSFVEFRSIDEARRAKEGLQGRLFNDPRIKILFSSSELAPSKDNSAFPPGVGEPGPDMFFNEPPYGPWPVELSGPARPMHPSNFHGPTMPNGMPGPNIPRRPFGPQGFDPHLQGPFSDTAHIFHNFPDLNPNIPMAANWRRHSPPPQGMWPPSRLMPGTWDRLETDPSQYGPKRPRMGDPSFIDDTPFHARNMDSEGGGVQFGFRPQLNRDASSILTNGQVEINHCPVGVRGPSVDHPSHAVHQGLPNNDNCWHGIIAKGGTPVCHARCVPIGKGIDSQLPEVVNCSARTGLDMLTKHYAEASGFDIVYFLPDSEEDFASYTEFLHYLGTKNRAGVVKLDDGTTLFLVPPSDFLTQVLNTSCSERLYGLVLKLPHKSTSITIQQPQQPHALPSQYVDGQQLPPPQTNYILPPQKDDQVLQVDYRRIVHEDSMPKAGGPKPLLAHPEESHSIQPGSLDHVGNPAAPPQAAVSLTPELIATLAALIPARTQSAALASSQLPVSSSTRPSLFPSSVTTYEEMSSQGWKQEHQAIASGSLYNLGQEKTSHVQNQLNSQDLALSQYSTFVNVANGPEHSTQIIPGGTQAQETAALDSQQIVIPTRPMNNFVIPSQAGPHSVSHANQQHQFDASQNSQNYGMVHTAVAAGIFHPPVLQQPKTTVSTQVESISQPQTSMTLVAEKVNPEFPNQVPQLPTIAAPIQGSSEADTDKSQRYQSTLQFAANLLLQLQQQQQQGNAQALQGSGSHP